MAFDRDTFHRQAVKTPSTDDISKMRSLVIEALAQEGYHPERDATGNVITTREATGSSSMHLVLNTHIDTVPPHLPFEQHDDIVQGRGACDAKGALAALVDVFCTAPIDAGRLTLAITPDEETTQFGGEHLGETLSADGYIVGEPTGLDVCYAARGGYGGRITVHGESAHASDPTDGTNAIRGVTPVLEALDRYDTERGPGKHEALGSPTLTPTHVEAGGPLNQVPAECTVSFDRRSVPPETTQSFFGELDSHLSQSLPDSYEYEVHPAYPGSPDPDPFVTDADTQLVEELAGASGGDIRAFEATTEASYFANDAPTVVFGPGVIADADGPVAHAEREYIHRSEIAAATETIRSTVEAILS